MQKLIGFARTVFAFCVLISVVVAVHEFAHLLTGLAFGATVEAFSIGFGPELIGFNAGGIHWQISAIPLGGYVSFPLEAAPGVVPIESLSTLAQVIVMLSGVAMNAVLAAVIAFVLRNKYKNDPMQYTMKLDMSGFLIVPFIRNAGKTFKEGQRYFWWFVASTSLDLMIFNALFFYPLDGGRVWMLILYDVMGLNISMTFAIIVGCLISFLFMMRLMGFFARPLIKYVWHAPYAEEQHWKAEWAEIRRQQDESDRRWQQTCDELGINPGQDHIDLPPRK